MEMSSNASENKMIWLCRAICVLCALTTFTYSGDVQSAVNVTWQYLLGCWVFRSVYFETWWTTIVYAFVLALPWLFGKTKCSEKYLIDPKMTWQSAGIRTILIEAVVYCAPLMTLDTFMVKKYHGVNGTLIELQKEHWIQRERMLPVEAPTVSQIILHLLGSFILYDFVFYLLHLSFHRNTWLYRYVHADHHAHDVLYSRTTNQLSVSERLALVLSANQALKTFNAHPLTRTIFVPLFIGWLVDNHAGFEFPWGIHKIIPFRIVGGPRYHFDHHMRGKRNYQPFFTYLDRIFTDKLKLT